MTASLKPGCWCGGKCPNLEPGLTLEREGRQREAELHFRRTLTKSPRCYQAHRHLARLMNASFRPAFALPHINYAAAYGGETPELALQRAWTLRNLAKMEEAVSAAARARYLAPDNVLAYQILAVCLEATGELEEAREAIEEARRRFGVTVPMRRITAVVQEAMGDPQGAIDVLQGDNLEPLELFDRGRFKEKLQDYAGAWSDWMRGKELQRKEGCIYDAAEGEKRYAELFDIARPGHYEFVSRNHETLRDPLPLFITGFPRSGTTMLEAVLTSHPRISAGDELMMLSEVIQAMPKFLKSGVAYPRALMASGISENAVMFSLLAELYQRKAVWKIFQEAGPAKIDQAKYFTDKMPSNELHWPLIHALFPESPIFHLQRHPLDILVSNMSHHLVHGNFVSCSLTSCAGELALRDELLDHYRRCIPSLRVETVRYEAFVADHRAAIDAMFANNVPGLKVHPDCYDFHKNPWNSRTISYRQIKQPVNAKSVGRYKPFLEFLKPVLRQLAPMMERGGYEV